MPVVGHGGAPEGTAVGADVPHPPAEANCLPALQAAGVARSLFGTPSRIEIESYFQQAEAALAKRRAVQHTR
ncbi:hypothetical protein HYH02_014739 [Chlamydomonas schloesseri]|uniref:Uncharacterized protein n=1 Tax=Chlamydomonas schloesseri TaxID=2026947 RepID=A0A835SGS1_9CHLO|nr:hypothetical protein HYH02_014739 [Chlamydomonas schloesseri]|eukprot:KAG2426699.1 hypothetical protein HYH02_014739 [Chlamydomonas schloesseri]